MELKNYLLKNYSKTTLASNLYMIRQFTDYTADAEKASYQDVLAYIAHLRKKNQHPKTIRNNLFAIKIYYRWLIGEGKRNDHPCQDLYLQDQINRSIDVENLYTKKQLEEFLETVKTKKQHMFLRDKTMVSLLVYQALTVLEISQLNVDDVNLDEGTIFIKGNIKNKSRTLNLQSSQIMLLHKYLQEGRVNLLKRKNKSLKEEALILSENGTQIQQHAISRQINYHRETHEKMTPMKIRQSVIAHLLKSGNDLRVVQVFAGHRRAASTEEYKQSGLEELKNAINKHHPLQ
jgi:site-specific recombinase XerD